MTGQVKSLVRGLLPRTIRPHVMLAGPLRGYRIVTSWHECAAALLRTQDLPPVFEENSCLYLFKRERFLAARNRLGRAPMLFEIAPGEALDIDEEHDFRLVETLLPGSTTRRREGLSRADSTRREACKGLDPPHLAGAGQHSPHHPNGRGAA